MLFKKEVHCLLCAEIEQRETTNHIKQLMQRNLLVALKEGVQMNAHDVFTAHAPETDFAINVGTEVLDVDISLATRASNSWKCQKLELDKFTDELFGNIISIIKIHFRIYKNDP